MARLNRTIKTTSLSLILALAYSGSSSASGFRIPEISTLGVGTSNALVANTTEIGALPYNLRLWHFMKEKSCPPGLLF